MEILINQPAEPAGIATFRIAYKNILGSNWTRWTHHFGDPQPITATVTLSARPVFFFWFRGQGLIAFNSVPPCESNSCR
jgi:hypothetical protein